VGFWERVRVGGAGGPVTVVRRKFWEEKIDGGADHRVEEIRGKRGKYGVLYVIRGDAQVIRGAGALRGPEN